MDIVGLLSSAAIGSIDLGILAAVDGWCQQAATESSESSNRLFTLEIFILVALIGATMMVFNTMIAIACDCRCCSKCDSYVTALADVIPLAAVHVCAGTLATAVAIANYQTSGWIGPALCTTHCLGLVPQLLWATLWTRIQHIRQAEHSVEQSAEQSVEQIEQRPPSSQEQMQLVEHLPPV
jgi:hypothetical protein